MRLEGTLDGFGLPDILQLLAFTKKTGALRLSAPPAAGVVHVREGAICAASSDTRRQVLARRVVGAGLVGDDALQAAVTTAADGSTGVVAALLEAGAVERDAVLPLAAEQTTDAVGELLRWTAGEFSFVVDDADPDGLPLALPIDEVVSEGQRRLAVWAELTAVIPSPDTALALAVAPAEEPRCSREEWGLLALVDGVRTVAEIVALLGRSEFAVMRALAGLVSRGLLVVPGAAGPGWRLRRAPPPAGAARRPRIRPRVGDGRCRPAVRRHRPGLRTRDRGRPGLPLLAPRHDLNRCPAGRSERRADRHRRRARRRRERPRPGPARRARGGRHGHHDPRPAELDARPRPPGRPGRAGPAGTRPEPLRERLRKGPYLPKARV